MLWALMDYDQSIQHPENVSLKQYRRPADEAWAGAEMYRPEDIYLGEPTYNPFAFDVAMLGNLFRVHFAVRRADIIVGTTGADMLARMQPQLCLH